MRLGHASCQCIRQINENGYLATFWAWDARKPPFASRINDSLSPIPNNQGSMVKIETQILS